ncbi:Pvc16 family protein [Yokenella regensburgei]|uniref:Pvc16 family protein n=1 Tax=Yokenella regensburgei TaxID=158877 RepID=UPI003ED9CC9F
MADQIKSDDAVLNVNRAILAALQEYVNASVDIRFDLPEPDVPPSQPTVSVFLYDIYEDLQLRTAESRPYNGGVLLPGRVNVCCNYLIMYWDKPATEGSPDRLPNNQATVIMNQVLNALINNRQLTGIPGAFTRVIPPKEELNSLGNFWQSLGNRPRLVLNYAVTVPVSQTDHNVVVPEVVETETRVEQMPR